MLGDAEKVSFIVTHITKLIICEQIEMEKGEWQGQSMVQKQRKGREWIGTGTDKYTNKENGRLDSYGQA
jgi:hypothetical protein